jgi:hypothetical protein
MRRVRVVKRNTKCSGMAKREMKFNEITTEVNMKFNGLP